MKRLLVISIALAASVALLGQETAQMKAKGKPVKAGDVITFTVTLDKAPSIGNVSVSVNVTPKGPNPQGVSGGNSIGPSDETKITYVVPITIPPHAPTGVWHVTGVQLNFRNGNKVLTFKDVEFTVQEDKKLVLPESATLEIAK